MGFVQPLASALSHLEEEFLVTEVDPRGDNVALIVLEQDDRVWRLMVFNRGHGPAIVDVTEFICTVERGLVAAAARWAAYGELNLITGTCELTRNDDNGEVDLWYKALVPALGLNAEYLALIATETIEAQQSGRRLFEL